MSLFGRKRKGPQAPGCAIVVVAAGSSQRMGQDKMFLELDGRPVLAHTLAALEASDRVEEIVVVTREDLVGPVAALAREMALTKVTKVVRGGATRVESAQLGVAEVSPQAKLIGIHDGARPFVSSQVMERVVDKAAQTGAAAPAIPVQDTIKVADADGFSADTLWLNLILTFALMSTQRIIIISTSVNIPNNPT